MIRKHIHTSCVTFDFSQTREAEIMNGKSPIQSTYLRKVLPKVYDTRDFVSKERHRSL
jgi:hypothetical protein